METTQTIDLSIPTLAEALSLPVRPRGRPPTSQSVSAKVREYKKVNPSATAVQVASALGFQTTTVRKIFSTYFPVRAKPKSKVKPKPPVTQSPDHPLKPIFEAAIEQVTKGKGVRHGGSATPFLKQPWAHYAQMHGRGFLTGQAAKKLEEAVTTKEGDAYVQELLGAIVYIGMAVLYSQEQKK